MRFRGIKFLGLCVVALGVMAFGAVAAHASEKATWLVGGTAISATLHPQIQTTGGGIENKDGILLTKSGLSPIEILCEELEFNDGLLLEKGGSSATTLLFKKCSMRINKEAAPACNPTTTGSTAGHVTTNPIKDLLVLNAAGEELDEVKPASGEAFVTFNFGKECAIGSEFKITGFTFLKDCEGKLLTDQLTHLVSEGPGGKIKFGGNAATLDGSSNLHLVGAGHEGKTWAGHAG